MRYYHDHELTYLNWQRDGRAEWGGQTSRDEFLQFAARPFLLHFLQEHVPQGSRVLELGCGSGAVAIFCAEQGYESWGIDIAPTAIAIADRLARTVGVMVRFVCEDVVTLDAKWPRFDLMIDSSCLHCLVFDDERSLALRTWREHLEPEGHLIVQSALASADIEVGQHHHLDREGVLWYRAHSTNLTESRVVNGAFWVPQRRLRTQVQLESELHQAGFEVLTATTLVGLRQQQMVRLTCRHLR